MPSFLLRGFWDALQRRGVSTTELERMSGVRRARRGDFFSTVAEEDLLRLYEAAAVLARDEALGISLASGINTAGLHLVGQIFLASITLREAIELATRVAPHVADCLPRFEELPNEQVRIGRPREAGAAALGARIYAEIKLVFARKLIMPFLEEPSERLAVQLPFPAPSDTSAYEHAFPGGVQFDADGTFVVIPRAALDRPRNGADASLLRQLFKLAQDQYGTAIDDADAEWTQRVRRALRGQTAPRLVDTERLASQLGVSLRGLSRRLAREGVQLSTLIDDVLFERARALLRRADATSKEIAADLGYAELSSFFRAFRRWSGGLTPNEYRQRQRASDGTGA